MSWDDKAVSWDDDPAVRAYSAAAFGSLRRVLAERGRALGGARVLDFGCGTGLLAVQIAAEAREVVALDISAPMIDVLRGKGVANIEPVCGDLPDLVRDGGGLGRFDLVTCSSVCAFVDDHPATVAELAGLLVPGGVFVQWDWELDPDSDEPWGLSRESIRAALTAAGLLDASVEVGFELPFGELVMAPLLGVGRRA